MVLECGLGGKLLAKAGNPLDSLSSEQVGVGIVRGVSSELDG